MQRLFLVFFALFISFALPVQDAEAKRLGGGKSYGMQRQAPMKREATPTPSPAQNSAAPAQAGKRSWMGPLAGLAAGLGLAALASHLGFGEEMANFLMLALLGIAIVMLVGWFMRRKQAAQPAYAGAGLPGNPPMRFEAPQAVAGSVASLNTTPANTAPAFPPDFDATAFVRTAKVNFLRMQAANDAGNLDDIREFTSPEMYAEIKLDIDERKGATQRTEIVTLEAEALEAVEDNGRQVVSVRFHGMLREDDEAATAFDETWHLTRPQDGSRGWVVAGIQQNG